MTDGAFKFVSEHTTVMQSYSLPVSKFRHLHRIEFTEWDVLINIMSTKNKGSKIQDFIALLNEKKYLTVLEYSQGVFEY